MRSKKSDHEYRIEEELRKCENILDDGSLTFKDGRELLDIVYKMLIAFQDLKKSRDRWRTKYEELRDDNKRKNK